MEAGEKARVDGLLEEVRLFFLLVAAIKCDQIVYVVFSDYHKVRVINMPPGSSWQDLKDFCRQVADVKFTEVRDGIGLAGFQSERDVRRVIEDLSGTKMKSHSVTFPSLIHLNNYF